MSYKYYSQTSSGWEITTDPDAEHAKRWRATHPQFGERFFAEHDDILKFTVSLMAKQLRYLFSKK